MKLRGYIPPVSIALFLVLTVAGTSYLRQRVLEKALISATEMDDKTMVRSVVDSWPSPVNARLPAVFSHAPMSTTVLHWAIQKGHYDLAHWLINRGADSNAQCFIVGSPREGRDCDCYMRETGQVDGVGTPLDYAVDAAQAELVRHLLRSGASVEGGRWLTPLSSAAEQGNIAIMTMLLDCGAGANGVPSESTSIPLRFAAENGRTEAVRLLLDRGASIDAVDGARWTALHYAVFYRHADTAALLLSRGADPAIKDTEGATALMMAEKQHLAYLAEMLRKAGANE